MPNYDSNRLPSESCISPHIFQILIMNHPTWNLTLYTVAFQYCLWHRFYCTFFMGRVGAKSSTRPELHNIFSQLILVVVVNVKQTLSPLLFIPTHPPCQNLTKLEWVGWHSTKNGTSYYCPIFSGRALLFVQLRALKVWGVQWTATACSGGETFVFTWGQNPSCLGTVRLLSRYG